MLKTKIQHDKITREVCRIFTLDLPEYYTFEPHLKFKINDFQIGVIVGSSGSGKSLLLKEFGNIEDVQWSPKPICSHFKDYEDAESRLLGAGLSSIPVWLAPYNVLSNGQKYRAQVARQLKNGAVFDEFTSVIDRDTSMALASSVYSYIKRQNLQKVVFATPHHDIIDYLKPDWVYDTDKHQLTLNSTVYGTKAPKENDLGRLRKIMEF